MVRQAAVCTNFLPKMLTSAEGVKKVDDRSLPLRFEVGMVNL